MTSAPAEEVVRVSTLELFFDLVFVFTITQLTTVLVHEPTGRGLGQVVLMLGVIWWMYAGYAWLTNAVAPTSTERRLLLLAAMAAYLVLALTIPRAFRDGGAAFGIAYFVVVLIHAGLFTLSGEASVTAAIKALAPYNLVTGALVLAGGIAGGDAQYVLWTLAFVGEWGTPRLHETTDFSVAPAHFVERHGLVLIVALGESVVAVGIGAAGLPVDLELVGVAVLGLLLSAALFWLFFGGDDDAAERALLAAPPRERALMALDAFGYWQLGMLLGVIGVAAGVKTSIGHPFDALDLAPTLMLGGGVALFTGGEVLMRRTFRIEPRRIRATAAVLSLATIPLGLLAASAQMVALVLLLGAALMAERQRTGAIGARLSPTPPR